MLAATDFLDYCCRSRFRLITPLRSVGVDQNHVLESFLVSFKSNFHAAKVIDTSLNG